MVDREFWRRATRGRAREGLDDPWTRHAVAVVEAATRSAHAKGEPGFLNGDLLEDHRSGSAWHKPACGDGSDLRSRRCRAEQAAGLIGELSRRAGRARFPATTNPCGEVVLHVTGGDCAWRSRRGRSREASGTGRRGERSRSRRRS